MPASTAGFGPRCAAAEEGWALAVETMAKDRYQMVDVKLYAKPMPIDVDRRRPLGAAHPGGGDRGRRRRLAVYETPFVVTHDAALFARDQGIRGAERYPGIGVPVL